MLAFILLIVVSSGKAFTSYDLPSPQKDPTACGRQNGKSAICDPEGYISGSTADQIDGIINFIQEGSHGFKKVECKGSESGPQIAVAVVGSMSGGRGSKEAQAFQFAKDLHDRWGVGEASCQNGIVIFLAVKDRSMAFSVGAGVKNIFTDNMVPKVMALMKPKMRDGEFGEAIVVAVTAVGNILSTGKAPEGYYSEESNWAGFFFFAIFASVFGIIKCVDWRKRRRYNGSKKLLEKIDKDRTAANKDSYVITSCPICLEDFPNADNSGATESSGNSKGALLPTTVNNVRTIQAGQRSDRSSSTASLGSTLPSDSEKVLLCGHKFHENCITSWISGTGSSNQLCPICRQPIVESSTDRIEQRTNNGRPSGWDVYDAEYSFRMRRAHYYYPDYITWNLINAWERDRYRHNQPMTNTAAFVAVDPVVIASQARLSGGGGSNFSFGGGSSAGGGGGGGSW